MNILGEAALGHTNEDLAFLNQASYLKMISGIGPSPSEIQTLLSHLPHLLIFVTTSGISEHSPENADVLYAYPSNTADQPLSPAYRLFKSRGVFVTLGQLLGQVTGNEEKPKITSVVLDGNMNDPGGGSVSESQLIHIGYEEENGDLLLLALPGNIKWPRTAMQKLRPVDITI